MKYSKAKEVLVSDGYPWGFRLKTTRKDWLEFDKKKGFRHVSQTIDPRTGKECKPKKSTYQDILVLGKNEENHTKLIDFEFYNEKTVTKTIEFLSDQDNFDLFTSEQIEYIYMKFLQWVKSTMFSMVNYCGSDLEELKKVFNTAIDIAKKGIEAKGLNNYFNQIVIDWEALEGAKVEGYQPFKVTNYQI